MAKKSDSESDTSDREIVITRLVDAPRDLVWSAWTTPDKIARWWGPNGFTNTIHEMNVRPGGVWRYVMHGPDGIDYNNCVSYIEVVAPERLVYGHGDDDAGSPCQFRATATFEAVGEKTRVTLRMLFETSALRDLTAKSGAVEGGSQTLERFDTDVVFAAAEARGDQPFSISRVFDAPRDVVWRAHADATSMAKWWGPMGWAVDVKTLDFMPGGIFHYVMRSKVAPEMWGRFTYCELVAPRRMVYVSAFSNAQAGVERAPFGSHWPLSVLNVVTMEEDDGKTRLTLTATPLTLDADERAAFAGMFQSMKQGFGGTFAQLDEFLSHGRRDVAAPANKETGDAG